MEAVVRCCCVVGAGEREARRMSWTPGAEGAPLFRCGTEAVLEVWVALEAGGAMRRDCLEVSR